MTRIAFEAAIADRTERLDAARQKGEEMIRNFQALATEQEVLEGEIHCLAQGFEWGLAAHDPEEAPRELTDLIQCIDRGCDRRRDPCWFMHVEAARRALTPPSQGDADD